MMHQVAPGIWTLHYPLSVLGTNHGRTVTVIRLDSGKLLIHSMAPFSPEDIAAIRAQGEPAWLAEVMLFHDTYAAQGRGAAPMRVEHVDEHTVVVSSEQPGRDGAAATRITIAHGAVVAMRQYASRDQALTAPAG